MNALKRFKRELTSFECLPNELFIEIFAYLNGTDTIYAFFQLNIRFQDLLNSYVKNLDFQCVSKAKSIYILQVFNLTRCRSLHLSDGNETPGQIKLFSQLFSFHYLSQLEYLYVLNMSYADALVFLPVISFLTNLTSLSISNICGLHIKPFILPNLKQLTFTGCQQTDWLIKFENLESLDYTIKDECVHNSALVLPKQLKRLKILYRYTTELDKIRFLLPNLSQLNTLALYTYSHQTTIPNGRLWEDLIVSYLPLLTKFQFCFPFENYRNTLDNLNEIIDSYSTPFYLIDKHWFIRCDRDIDMYIANTGVLYSLPYAFSQMSINIQSFDTSISTLPVSNFDETKSKYYQKIRTITYNKNCKTPHLGFLSSNIENLILSYELPLSWLYIFSNIHHLTLKGGGKLAPADFENILRHTPKLQSLTITNQKLQYLTEKFSNQIICQYLSERIRSLTISQQYSNSSALGYVSVRLLNSIVRLLHDNCEHLSLALAAHPNTVRPILKRMKKLRSLHIQWEYLALRTESPISVWLNKQSANINDLDFVHSQNRDHLSIWFGSHL